MFAGMPARTPNEHGIGAAPRRFEWPGWTIERVRETGSTNADALAAARGGAPAGLVIVADHQTAGRGRLGRAWEDRPGDGLIVSVLLRPSLAPNELHRLTQAFALAAVDACADVAGFRPDIKWPNDLLVSGRKLAGVLAESIVEERHVVAVVVGMGMNVLAAPPGAISIADVAERDVDRFAVLDAFLARLSELTFDTISTRYRRELSTLGQQVRVEQSSGVLEGIAREVTDDGHLVVAVGADAIEVNAGDVVHLRRLT